MNPSAQLERHRQEYYDRLLGVSQKGDWSGWFEFFARSIAEEAIDAVKRIERLENLRESYHLKFRAARASVLLTSLVDQLFIDPAVTVNGVATKLKIQFSTARDLVQKLQAANIVREVTGQARNRVFLAQGIVDIFSTDE